MKLFLASEAKHPLSVVQLEKFVKPLKECSIAYIPTAANGEEWGRWKEGGAWNLLQSCGAQVTVCELEYCSEEETREKLNGKDIVWVGGGACGYLLYWMRRRRINRYITDILESGSVYVGSSAGSMVAGHSISVVDWYPGEDEFGASVIPALQLVNFDIFPHFNYREEYWDLITEKYTGPQLYVLKDGEEVLVDGTTVQVIGEERIICS